MNYLFWQRRGIRLDIQILRLIEGARQARGLTVIIDVFRAFSLECYLYHMGARAILPVGRIGDALALRERIDGCVLIGERGGKKCEGFDFGNSPSSVSPRAVAGKTVVHTTSAGTQGVVNARGAAEILTGSLVNARAIAEYIRGRQPEAVSLVCMGNSGTSPAPEDELCAEYIRSLLEGREMADIQQRAHALRFGGGSRFFEPEMQEIFPEPDFWLCTECDRFPFVIRVHSDANGFRTEKIEVV